MVLFVSLLVVALGHSPSGARGLIPPPVTQVTPAPFKLPDLPQTPGQPVPTATLDPSEVDPLGISQTNATLADVLRLFVKGRGTPTTPFTTVSVTATLDELGETGTYTEIASGDDYLDTTQLGPTTFSTGTYHGQSWQLDENGLVNLITGVHEEQNISDKAFGDALRGKNDGSVKLLGVVASPVKAYVVEVDPKGGRLEWIFIDASTGRVVRREAARTGHRLVYSYDDFRTVNGITTAWHTHYNNGYEGNDFDRQTTAIEYGKPVSDTDLRIPQSRPLIHFPPGVTDVRLPSHMDDGVIVVRLTINGRGLDFQLDSGAAGIVLDADVAKQLGLTTFEPITASVAGTFKAAQAIIPQVQIGDLTMDNVAVDCLPFNSQLDTHTKIVGLLGYDFIASAIVKVDYLHQTVDALDPSAFTTPKGNVFEMPIKLDDHQPMVTATLGDNSFGTFIVDTGASEVLLYPPFVDTHRQDLAMIEFEFGGMTVMPIFSGRGVGGALDLRPFDAPSFQFAGIGFNDFHVYEPLTNRDFIGEDNDGLIGYEFLHYFDVYFDYKDSMIMFQPNALLAGKDTIGL